MMESTDFVQDGDCRPAILLVDSECDALYALALAIQPREPERAALLLAELDRAEVCSVAAVPTDVVTMNSRVTFIDDKNGAERTVVLVYPQDADIEAGLVSVLSPVGVGLIGTRAGAAILWSDRDRQDRLLRILRVSPPSGR